MQDQLTFARRGAGSEVACLCDSGKSVLTAKELGTPPLTLLPDSSPLAYPRSQSLGSLGRGENKAPPGGNSTY